MVVDEKMHKAFKVKTRGVPHSVAEAAPEISKRFDFFLQEHRRVTADIQGMKNVAEIVRGLSLPTMLLVNECNAEVVPIDKSLQKRSRQLLKQPPLQVESQCPMKKIAS